MNSTPKTSGHFSKLRGLQASILLFAPPRPASSCFCSLSPLFFLWPECGKLLRMRMLAMQATPNLCWTLTFTLTFTIHCHSHRQHSPLPSTITINCHCYHTLSSVLSPLLPSTIINLPPLPLFLHLSTIHGHDHLLLS